MYWDDSDSTASVAVGENSVRFLAWNDGALSRNGGPTTYHESQLAAKARAEEINRSSLEGK